MAQPTVTAPIPLAEGQAPAPAPVASRAARLRASADHARRLSRELPGRLRALPRQAIQSWPWLLVALVYLGAWWFPFRWSKEEWFRPHHIEMFQPWLPLATWFLIYTRRHELREVWERSLRKRQTWRVGFWEAGNAIPLILGCALLLLMHLIQVKGLSVIALILIGVGVAYHVFGARVLRAMAAPWALLILMIPLPDSLLEKIGRFAITATLQGLIAGLRVLRHPAVVEGKSIRFLSNNFTVDLSRPGLSATDVVVPIGLDVAVGVALAMLIYGLYQRRGSLQILGAMMTGAIFSIAVNFARMLWVSLITERNPSAAEPFRDYNAWVMVLLVSLVTEQVMRRQARWLGRWFSAPPNSRNGSPFAYFLQRVGFVASLPFQPLFIALGLVGRAGGGMNQMARRNEQRTERVLQTVSPLTRVFLLPVTLLRRSEKAIENLLRRAAKKRGRGSSRNRSRRW